ncbi:hypothetical protein ASD00_36265 [Ensifer sp. Root31]|nr:hypothetical protein ASD00_36265 [Ensifer sp. Root31]
MAADDIAQLAWTVTARHLMRGQRDPTQMVVDAISVERQRCLAIVAQACGEHSDAARKIKEPAR